MVTAARTYFYEDEHACDDNVRHFIEGIEAVSTATNKTGFAAIKLTALGRPQFLLQLSAVLTAVRRYFEMLSRGYGTGTVSKDDLERHLHSFKLDPEQRRRWYTILDITNDGEIDLLDWHNLLEVNISLAKVLRVPNLKTGQLDPITTEFTDEEEEQMRNMLHRIDYIVRYAEERNVRVMIDAEQSYLQAAINRLTMEMMRKYNTEKACVFNTYQCYLKDALTTLNTDLALSKRENFYFGAKLVRGAYMEQERLRAATLGYEDPILPSFDATTRMYDSALTEVLKQINERERGKIAVMIATHNEDTVRLTVNRLGQLKNFCF
jgi:proline dehydrogenase